MDSLSKHGNCRNRGIRVWGLLGLFLLLLMGNAAAESLDGNSWYWRGDHGAVADESEADAAWVLSAMNQTGDWEPFSFSERPSLGGQVTHLWLMTTLPDHSFRDAAFYMESTGQSFEVWLDHLPLYRYGDMQPGLLSYGQRWHVILLPTDYAGKKLIIHTYASNPINLGRFGMLRLDSNVNQIKQILFHDIPSAVNIPLAVFMIMIILIYISSPVAPKKLYMAILAFLAVFLIWMVCVSNTKQLLLDAPGCWWLLQRILLYIMPLSANIVLFLIVNKEYKRQVWMTVLVYGGLLFVALTAEILGLNGLDGCASAYYIMMPALQLLTIYWVIHSAMLGNRYCRVVLLPQAAMTITGTIDGFAMQFHWLPEDVYLLPYTTILLALFLRFVVRQQIKRERYLMARAAGLESEVARAIEKAEMDPLTQCYNRTKMDAVLKDELRKHQQEQIPFTLIMLDIDFFKRINDTFGHEAGDEVLAGFAAVVRQHIKKRDVLVRWGGEEFILICRNCTGEEALTVAERLRIQVEQAELFSEAHVTCSIGVASWQGAADSLNRLLKRVDDALYEAKRSGRNRVCREDVSTLV